MLAHVFVTLFPEPGSDRRVGEQKADLVGRTFNRMREQARVLVNHLRGNSAHGGSDDGFFLPQPFRYRQAEALPAGFSE